MPVLYPQFKLKLGKWWLRGVHKLKLTSSRKQPVDVLEIELPLHPEFDLKEFKEGGGAVGEEVILKLGYDEPAPLVVFTGMITEVSPDQPLKIRCEDHGRALKIARYSKTYDSKNVYTPLGIPEGWHSAIAHDAITKAGLTPIVPRCVDEGDFKRKTFVVDNQTCAQVLDKMREIGWDWFVIPGTKECYFGPPWPYARGILEQRRRAVFTFGEAYEHRTMLADVEFLPNIIEPQTLTFTPSKKVGKVTVYMTDTEFTRKGVTGSYGEGEPELKFDFEGSLDEGSKAQDEANKRAQQLWLQLKSQSYEGSFKTFGFPFLMHSQAIRLNDPAHDERSGVYWTDTIEHEFDPDGFFTTVSLCEREESIK